MTPETAAEPADDQWPEHYLEPGELLNDRYEITQRLQRDSSVYSAVDRHRDDAPVAIRTISPVLTDPSQLAQLEQQILATRSVTHPHVCRVLQVDFDGGPLPYYVMEWLDGETLAARIQREGGMPAREAIPLIRQMAAGLDAAHAAGVVHLDFRTSNVMLAAGRVVILDFGLARMGPGRFVGNAMGVFAYASPEEILGQTVDAVANLYSLGAVLYEMAAGKRPFPFTEAGEYFARRMSGEVPRVRRDVPGVDKRWELAIERCLQKSPGRRFPSAAAVAAHFADWERLARE